MSQDSRIIRDVMSDALLEADAGPGREGRVTEVVLTRLAEAGFVVRRAEPQPERNVLLGVAEFMPLHAAQPEWVEDL